MPRRAAAIALLSGLIVADVVLVTGALRSTHVDTSQLAQAAAAHTASPASTPPPADVASGASAGAGLPQGKVTIAALSNTRAWRAATPSMACTKGAKNATIRRTQDGGKDWTSVQVPMTTVSGLSYADGRILATGLDSSCHRTSYALSSTSEPTKVTTTPAWGIDPSAMTRLLASGKPVTKQPCSSGLLDIAANSASNAVVLCGDHSIRTTTDAGASWKRQKAGSGVIAIATDPSAIFTATRAKCGIAVSATSSGTSANCVAGTKNWKGSVDMTIVGGTVWLVSADAAVTEQVTDVR